MALIIQGIKWLIFFVVVYFIGKAVHTLVTTPNLRYYLWKTIKDMKYMYYRYHV